MVDYEIIETICKSGFTCIYCGHKDDDFYQLTNDDDYEFNSVQSEKVKCPDCNKEFYMNRNIRITYSKSANN